MDKVKIDARKDTHPEFRPFAVRGAIAAFASALQVGEEVIVEDVIGPRGEKISLAAFRTNLNSVKKSVGREFVTRKSNDGLCMVACIE